MGWGQHPREKVLQLSTTPAERRLIASAAGAAGWARTVDRAARGRHGQQGLFAKYLRDVPAKITDPDARRKAAESRMRAHYAQMALKSLKVRRAKREAREREAAELKAARAAELKAKRANEAAAYGVSRARIGTTRAAVCAVSTPTETAGWQKSGTTESKSISATSPPSRRRRKSHDSNGLSCSAMTPTTSWPWGDRKGKPPRGQRGGITHDQGSR
jgi:hypothetical protein